MEELGDGLEDVLSNYSILKEPVSQETAVKMAAETITKTSRDHGEETQVIREFQDPVDEGQ